MKTAHGSLRHCLASCLFLFSALSAVVAQDLYIQPGVNLQLPVGAYTKYQGFGAGPSVAMQVARKRHWGSRVDVSTAVLSSKTGGDKRLIMNICGGMDYFYDRRPKGIYTGLLIGYIGQFPLGDDNDDESLFPDARVTPMLAIGHMSDKVDVSFRGGVYASSIVEEPNMWYLCLSAQYRIRTDR